MDASRKRTFYYHANANPIGGQITEPLHHTLTAHASTALAQAGGHSKAIAHGHKVDSVLSFAHAHSEIFGHTVNETKVGHWLTTVTSVIEGLDVLGIVHADSIIARITVKHPHSGERPWVSFAGTQFNNLTIGHQKIVPKVNLDSFSRIEAELERESEDDSASDEGLDLAASEYKSNLTIVGSPKSAASGIHEGARTAALKHSRTLLSTPNLPKWVSERYEGKADEAALISKGQILCSLVEQIDVTKEPEDTSHYPTYGHIIHVPDVGNLFLGELALKHGGFRLNMLRIEMGCLAEGTVSAASAESDGSPMP